MNVPAKHFYSIAEVAKDWNCTEEHIFHLAAQGDLKLGLRFSDKIFYGMQVLHVRGFYVVTGILLLPSQCMESWGHGSREPSSAAYFVVDKRFPPEAVSPLYCPEQDVPCKGDLWVTDFSPSNPDLDTSKLDSFWVSDNPPADVIPIHRDQAILPAAERKRFELVMRLRDRFPSDTDEKFGWAVAGRQIQRGLGIDGDHWPSYLTTTQIAKLHFPEDSCREEALLREMEDAAKSEELFCEATCVVVAPSGTEIPSLSSGTLLATEQFPGLLQDGQGKRALVKPPLVPWEKFLLRAIRKHEANFSLKIHETYQDGVPSSWEVILPSRDPLHFEAAGVVAAVAYAQWKRRPSFPMESVLPGWISAHCSGLRSEVLRALLDMQEDPIHIEPTQLGKCPDQANPKGRAPAWSDVYLTLRFDDTVEIRIKGESKRVSFREFGIVDLRTNELNQAGTLLVGLTRGSRIPRRKENEKRVSRLRSLLKSRIQAEGEPLQEDWYPNFKISDKRNSREERAKRDARHEPYMEEETDQDDQSSSMHQSYFDDKFDDYTIEDVDGYDPAAPYVTGQLVRR